MYERQYVRKTRLKCLKEIKQSFRWVMNIYSVSISQRNIEKKLASREVIVTSKQDTVTSRRHVNWCHMALCDVTTISQMDLAGKLMSHFEYWWDMINWRQIVRSISPLNVTGKFPSRNFTSRDVVTWRDIAVSIRGVTRYSYVMGHQLLR